FNKLIHRVESLHLVPARILALQYEYVVILSRSVGLVDGKFDPVGDAEAVRSVVTAQRPEHPDDDPRLRQCADGECQDGHHRPHQQCAEALRTEILPRQIIVPPERSCGTYLQGARNFMVYSACNSFSLPPTPEKTFCFCTLKVKVHQS